MNPDEANTIAAIAKNTAFAGAGSAAYGGFTANEIAAFGGLAVAILGVLIQFYFKVRADRRESELHRERLARVRQAGWREP